MQNVPVELREGVRLRFAASSRDYILHCSTSTEDSAGAAEEPSTSAALGGVKRPGQSLPGNSQECQVLTCLGLLEHEEGFTCHNGSVRSDCFKLHLGEEAQGSAVG